MRATWRQGEIGGKFEHPVIVPQMTEGGFMLIGFRDWEAVHEEKMCAAITNLEEFEIHDNEVGFGSK